MNLRRGLSSGLLLLVLGLCGPSIHAQPDRNGPYRQPAEFNLEGTRKFFREFRRQIGNPTYDFYFLSFYPIGWSRDGKFAYYFEPDAAESYQYFAKLFIIDLKTDKVVWSFDYKTEHGLDEARKTGTPYTIATLWSANRQLFSDKLREHGIVQQRTFRRMSFPISHRGDLLTAKLRTREKPGLTDDERPYGTVGRTTLHINSKRYGSKTVFEQTNDEPYTLPLYVGLVGYLKSPFEPRIAALLIEITRGWEGAPHPAEVKIAGASLEGGFK